MFPFRRAAKEHTPSATNGADAGRRETLRFIVIGSTALATTWGLSLIFGSGVDTNLPPIPYDWNGQSPEDQVRQLNEQATAMAATLASAMNQAAHEYPQDSSINPGNNTALPSERFARRAGSTLPGSQDGEYRFKIGAHNFDTQGNPDLNAISSVEAEAVAFTTDPDGTVVEHIAYGMNLAAIDEGSGWQIVLTQLQAPDALSINTASFDTRDPSSLSSGLMMSIMQQCQLCIDSATKASPDSVGTLPPLGK